MNTRTDIDEDLIRQALERQAQSALSADRIRAALPARIARRRQARRIRTGVVLVAAAVAVLVAVPFLGLPRGSLPVVTSASPATTRQAAAPVSVPLRYRPTWLPPGFTERYRAGTGGADGMTNQAWTKQPLGARLFNGGPRLELIVQTTADGRYPDGTTGTTVDVRGRPGLLHGRPGVDDTAYLRWLPDDTTLLTLSVVNYRLSEADLLKVARAVQPSSIVQTAAVRLGWLPDSLVASTGLTVAANSSRYWRASVSAQPLGSPAQMTSSDRDRASVWVSVGTQTFAPRGGERLTVSGHPARLVTRNPESGAPLEQSYLVVDVDSGLRVTVFATDMSTTRSDLIGIAEHVEVDPHPDLSWAGAR